MCTFVNGFISQLDGIIPDDMLRTIYLKLSAYAADFDIEKKCTELATAQDLFPTTAVEYLAIMKVEGLSMKTIENYARKLKFFFSRMMKPVEEISKQDVIAYMYNDLQRDRGLSDSSVNSELAALRSFFSWAVSEGHLPKNPCDGIKHVKCDKKEPVHLTEMEMEMLRKACQTPKESALVEFFYSTGCRVSEILNVKRQDIDWINEELTIYGKGKKYRKVYLSARCIVTLKSYFSSREDDNEALFVSDRKPHGPIRSVRRVQRIFDELGVRAGIQKHVHPHLLRHTTATIALEKGVPIEQVQRILGHSDISTTLIYAEVANRDVKQSHKRAIV